LKKEEKWKARESVEGWATLTDGSYEKGEESYG